MKRILTFIEIKIAQFFGCVLLIGFFIVLSFALVLGFMFKLDWELIEKLDRR